MPLDDALADRFGVTLTLSYLPPQYEKQLVMTRVGMSDPDATEIIVSIEELRGNTQSPVEISTRSVLEIAEMVKFQVPLIDALRANVAVTADKMESVLQTLHFGGKEVDRYEMTTYIPFTGA